MASGRHTAAHGNELRLTSNYRHGLGIQLPRALGLAPHLSCFFVRAQPEKCRVPQPPVASEFHEPDLRDKLGARPLHLAHLLSRDAGAPTRFFVVRQVGERAVVDPKGLELAHDFAAYGRNEPRPYFAGK